MVNSNVQYGESLLQHTIHYPSSIRTRSRNKMFKAVIESANMYKLNKDTIIKLFFRTTYSHFDIYQFYKKIEKLKFCYQEEKLSSYLIRLNLVLKNF